MSAQTPFDKMTSHFEIHKVMKGDVAFAGAHFVKADAPIDPANPLAITCIGGPVELLPENCKDPNLLRAEFEWLIGGCAAFHDVEVWNFIDDPAKPEIRQRRSSFMKGN